MKVVVEVELGNEAMKSAYDVGLAINRALILQSAQAMDPMGDHEVGSIRDRNGNTVGKWEVVDV